MYQILRMQFQKSLMKQGLKFKLSTVTHQVFYMLSTTISENTLHIQIPPLQAWVSLWQDWNLSPRGTTGGGSRMASMPKLSPSIQGVASHTTIWDQTMTACRYLSSRLSSLADSPIISHSKQGSILIHLPSSSHLPPPKRCLQLSSCMAMVLAYSFLPEVSRADSMDLHVWNILVCCRLGWHGLLCICTIFQVWVKHNDIPCHMCKTESFFIGLIEG